MKIFHLRIHEKNFFNNLDRLEFDPGLFLGTKEKEFPLLSEVAKKLPLLPATSVTLKVYLAYQE